MATLPDFDAENEAGYVAYYKAGSTPDIENFVSNANLQEYTIYDNGVAGTIARHDGTDKNPVVLWRFRIKTDGWIVMYMPQDGYTSDYYSINLDEYYPDGFDFPRSVYTGFGIKNAGVYYAWNCGSTDNGLYEEFSRFSGYLNINGPSSFGDIGIYDYNVSDADSLSISIVGNYEEGEVSIADVSQIHLAHLYRQPEYDSGPFLIEGDQYGGRRDVVGIDLEYVGFVEPGGGFSFETDDRESIYIVVYYTP